MCAIRIIFNPPYSYYTPRAVIDASPKERYHALVDARTQHEAKTAEQIGLVGETVAKIFFPQMAGLLLLMVTSLSTSYASKRIVIEPKNAKYCKRTSRASAR